MKCPRSLRKIVGSTLVVLALSACNVLQPTPTSTPTSTPPFTVTEVSQKLDYSLIYVKIGSLDPDSPQVFSRDTVYAVDAEGIKHPMEGVAPAGNIVLALPAFEVDVAEDGSASIGIPDGEFRLMFMLPRQLKKSEIALAFRARKEDLVSIEIDDIVLRLP